MDRQSIGSLLGKSATSPRKRMSIVQSLKKNTRRFSCNRLSWLFVISTLSVSGRSNQSAQVICRTSSHVVESFGSPLPVLVTEALTFVDRQTAVSVNVSPDGWAWLVCGRRLLVWQCKTTIHDPKQRRTFKSQCRELLLPQSDLAHRAECVAVWLPPAQQVPSCIAVSPEGIVRYWSSVAHEASSVETSAELAGQEVDCLTHVPGHGCILATTTCTVALLQPQFLAGRNQISCRVLRTSQGWLGGIGRRMSSLIFGAIPQSPVMETKLVKVTCSGVGDRDSRVLILAGSSLQYWSFPHGDQEKMEFDEDIGHLVSQAFQRRFWESSACNPNNVATWLIDMQPCDEGIVLLMAAHCADLSPRIHFAIGLVPLTRTTLTNSFKWFTPVKIGFMMYDSQNEEFIESAIFSHRFILSGWEAIVYNNRNVVVINSMNEHDQEKIDLMRGEEDRILGGALCSGTPVLFTRNLALITVMPTDFSSQDFDGSYLGAGGGNGMDNTLNNSTITENTSCCAVSDEKLQDMYYSSDAVQQLSAAFLLSLRRNRAECENIISELFPLQDEPIMDIDANLDTIVLKVAKNVIDDYPANDPRWSNRRDFSSTMNAVFSVQIPPQLEGKQKALDLYVTFLKEENLWNRFCAVTYRGIIMSTAHVLGEYAEKIVAASTLYNLQTRYPEILDPMIEETVKNHHLDEEPRMSDEITARDIFFRQVSTVDRVLHALVDSAADKTLSENSSQQVSQYIHQANCILLGVLRQVIKYRQQNAERYVPSGCTNGITEYLPWTAATGKHGLRGCLNTMQNLTLKHGISGTIDSSLRNELSEQLVGLIDLILDGRKCHLESLRGTEKFEILLKQYETERTNLLQPLIKDKQYENAAMVAEKYLDFASLVQICELTENKSRLNNYMERFSAQDFVGFMFSWYVKNGRQGQLVERCRRPGAVELTEKLSEHPSLSWVQAGLTGEYRSAANTLHSLAHNELELVRRKKTMLSLAKLAILASNEADEEVAEDMKIINNELKLIEHQEDVSEGVLETYGYDTNKMRVLSAVELVTLYTCEENVLANEYDFKKGLDLLEHVEPEEERSVIKLKIWARAVRRDRWDTVSKNPEQQVTETLFFKLIDLCHTIGCQTKDFLPDVALLLSEPELGTLAASSSFQYLIKFVYEYAQRVFGIL